MEGYLEGWNEFNVAMMGAVAALAGLLIVAASVNIAEIVKAPSVAARLAAGLGGLVLAIASSAFGLIPDIPSLVYGAVVLVCALGAGSIQVQATRQIYANRDPRNEFRLGKAVFGFLAPAAYACGALVLMLGMPWGLVLFAVGAIASIIAGIVISWIALVEVLR